MKGITIGDCVMFKMDGGIYCGHVVSFSHRIAALCFVEQVIEGGNKPWPNPILFVDRNDLSPSLPHGAGEPSLDGGVVDLS